MTRVSLLFAIAALFVVIVAGPAAAAGGPSAQVAKPGGCSTIVYSWANQRKARTAELRIHHFGVFETSRSVTPVAASGSFVMPADVTFVPGDQYTVLGLLLDSAGRSISPSGAVWWGTC